MNRESGFTAVELMVTVAVAGILAAVAIPSFNTLVSNNRVSSIANEFVGAASFARQEAIKRGSAVTICRSSTGSSCGGGSGWEAGWIVFNDPDRNGTVGSGETVLRGHGAFGNSFNSLRGNNNVANRVTFSDQGMAPGFFGSLTACDTKRPANARFVTIAPSGRATISTRDTLPGDVNPPTCPP